MRRLQVAKRMHVYFGKVMALFCSCMKKKENREKFSLKILTPLQKAVSSFSNKQIQNWQQAYPDLSLGLTEAA